MKMVIRRMHLAFQCMHIVYGHQNKDVDCLVATTFRLVSCLLKSFFPAPNLSSNNTHGAGVVELNTPYSGVLINQFHTSCGGIRWQLVPRQVPKHNGLLVKRYQAQP
jgi:hypothetical protein